MAKKKWSRTKKIILSFVLILLIGAASLGIDLYMRLYSPNVIVGAGEKNFLYIPTGTTFPQLINLLTDKKIVRNSESFRWAAERLELPENLHPGRYELQPQMNNYELIKLIRSGQQTPVKLVINKFRTKEDFTAFISDKLEIDSTLFFTMLNDEVYLREMDFNPENVMAVFVPNTYEFYWTIKEREFIERMKREYDKFWTVQRRQKAEALQLSPIQVSILASILEEETNRNDEKPTIASVYLNRLKKDMPLQADPTVKFSVKNFLLRRVLRIHTDNESPYNTYKHKGLPPGPICTPSIKSIDAVLNPVASDYLYFCASVERPGYHAFASNYKEHQKNAAKYQKYLNQQNIR